MFGRLKEKKNDEKKQPEKKPVSFEAVHEILSKSHDYKERSLLIGGNPQLAAHVVYIDGMVDKELLSEALIRPLLAMDAFTRAQNCDQVIADIEAGYVFLGEYALLEDLNSALNAVIHGEVVLLFADFQKAVSFDIKHWEKRSIGEPTEENVIKGAKDCFIEDLKINLVTIRKKIKNINLVFENTTVGKQTLTAVAIVYIEGLTNPSFITQLKKQLASIDTGSVLTTAAIEDYITDNKRTPFPLTVPTERPDKFCAGIVEGRVGIVIDGIPFALIIPGTLLQFMQAPDDYANSHFIGSAIRILRFLLMLGALFLPGFYIAITTFHQEMIPTQLALSIGSSEQGVPYPTFIEIFIMLIAFEILTEAGLRMPKTIGQAVSIVGALVVGQAAVSAKLLSPAVVIVIAFTVISHFAIPSQSLSNALRIWRFILAIFSSIIGLFGLVVGGILLLYHLSTIECYGVPYLSPFVSTDFKQMEDSIVVTHSSKMTFRPLELRPLNKRRQK